MKDNDDIQKCISQACGMFAPMKGVLCNLKIYQPTIEFEYTTQLLSIFFYNRERGSWALTEELQRKLEVCHHRFLRRMVDVNHNLYDVNDHHISNEQVRREELGNCCVVYINHYDLEGKRGPRNALLSWLLGKPGKAGGQQEYSTRC